jgi:hypothetical protein
MDSMRDAPVLREESTKKRRFMFTLFFDEFRNDSDDRSETFEADELSTMLENAFYRWSSAPPWEKLTVMEVDREDKLAEVSSLALINELQKRKVRMKVDDEMYQVVVSL